MKTTVTSYRSFSLTPENDADRALLRAWDTKYRKVRIGGSGYRAGEPDPFYLLIEFAEGAKGDGADERCPACGDNRTGKGSYTVDDKAFCDNSCLLAWQRSVIDEAKE